MIIFVAGIFDFFEKKWESAATHKLISWFLIGGFLLGLFLAGLYDLLDISILHRPINYFLAIDLAFQILLIVEILGLIFVLPRSVADSVGKQFEILSIILLRSAFKEFGSFEHPVEWTNVIYDPLFHMLSDAFGALIIFLIIGFYYNKQKHERITKNETEQVGFIRFKKTLAFVLMIVFFYLGFTDIKHLLQSGSYSDSFNTFYTILIFTDVAILLYSLRYSSRYYNLFRYSSFAFATILIRIALTAPPYVNVILGITAGAFVLGLTLIYNYFLLKRID